MGVLCSISFEKDNSNTIRQSQTERLNPWIRANQKHDNKGIESTGSKPAQCYMMNPFEYMNLKIENKENSVFEKIIVDGRPASSTSNVTKSRAGNSQNLGTFTDPNQTCEICWDESSSDEFVRLENCQHIYHLSCIMAYLNSMIITQILPIKCPDSKCDKNIDNIGSYLRGNDLEKFRQVWKSQYQKEVLKCQTPGCNFAIILDGKSSVYCLGCFNSHNLVGSSDKEFLKFVNGKNFRQCTNCNWWVEKSQGCNHMTCRCKHEFCYLCGAKWRTCKCNQ